VGAPKSMPVFLLERRSFWAVMLVAAAASVGGGSIVAWQRGSMQAQDVTTVRVGAVVSSEAALAAVAARDSLRAVVDSLRDVRQNEINILSRYADSLFYAGQRRLTHRVARLEDSLHVYRTRADSTDEYMQALRKNDVARLHVLELIQENRLPASPQPPQRKR